MSNKNKFGLSRAIPHKVKLQVRKESYYGCVVCGVCPYEYDHISPDFINCTEHHASNITLLCDTCHKKKTNKLLSVEKVLAAKKDPWCKINNHTHMGLDFTGEEITFRFGCTSLINCKMPIYIVDKAFISATYSVVEKSIIISAEFYNGDDEPIGLINNNEWQGLIGDFDINVISNKIEIKHNKKLILELEAIAPNTLIVHHMYINYKGNIVFVDKNHPKSGLVVIGNEGGVFLTFDDNEIIGVGKIVLDNTLTIHGHNEI